jgi:hypothetical protein
VPAAFLEAAASIYGVGDAWGHLSGNRSLKS